MEIAPHRSAIAVLMTIALSAVLILVLAPRAKAEPGAAAFQRDLTEVELHLRFGIELGPAELDQDIGFTEKLCLAAETAEAAGEDPAAKVDWQGLEHVVRHNDLAVVGEIAAALRGADRRVTTLGRKFKGSWSASPARARRRQQLRRGVVDVRSGVLHFEAALTGFRTGFQRFLRYECEGGQAAIEGTSRPIRRGLVRINSGMGLLWILAEAT